MVASMHPRSKVTGTIFWGTLAASFMVVGMPHLLPCPAPRVAYQEGVPGPDGKIRRRRRCASEGGTDGSITEQGAAMLRASPANIEDEDLEEIKSEKRDCPIPKPAVMVGQLLGMKKNTPGSSEKDSSTIAKPP